jgi:hypothetical protein
MFTVHQHPDGLVMVRENDRNLYMDTVDNFEDDFNVKLPPLPPGVDERIYEPRRRPGVRATR